MFSPDASTSSHPSVPYGQGLTKQILPEVPGLILRWKCTLGFCISTLWMFYGPALQHGTGVTISCQSFRFVRWRTLFSEKAICWPRGPDLQLTNGSQCRKSIFDLDADNRPSNHFCVHFWSFTLMTAPVAGVKQNDGWTCCHEHCFFRYSIWNLHHPTRQLVFPTKSWSQTKIMGKTQINHSRVEILEGRQAISEIKSKRISFRPCSIFRH